MGKEKSAKRLTLNLLTQTDRMSNFCAIPQYIKVYGHFYLMNDEVCNCAFSLNWDVILIYIVHGIVNPTILLFFNKFWCIKKC